MYTYSGPKRRAPGIPGVPVVLLMYEVRIVVRCAVIRCHLYLSVVRFKLYSYYLLWETVVMFSLYKQFLFINKLLLFVNFFSIRYT